MGRRPKVPVADRNAFDRDFDVSIRAYISAEDVDRIRHETSVDKNSNTPYIPSDFPLEDRLNGAYFWLLDEYRRETGNLSPGEEKKYLTQLNRQAGLFVEVLSEMSEDVFYKLAEIGAFDSKAGEPWTGSDYERVHEIKDQMIRLQKGVDQLLIDQAGQRKKQREDLRRLVGELAEIYLSATGKHPGLSFDAHANKPTGPFFRFGRACVPLFPLSNLSSITDTSIAKAIGVVIHQK